MYKLTNIMLQNLEKDLGKFHELFQGGRCQAWQLEELIARAINSDFNAKDKAFWKGNGHDIEADIKVGEHKISVKSGKIENGTLVLSGHRLGRFKGNLKEITDFLNKDKYFLVAVPYYLKENENGKEHNYQLFYIDTEIFKINSDKDWEVFYSKKNPSEIAGYEYTNVNKVCGKITKSMNWQIWWEIPIKNIPPENKTRVISIR